MDLPILQPVELPFGKVIYQHQGGQTITADTAEMVKFVLEDFDLSRIKILDVGSGTGIMPIMFSHYRPGWDVTGIEIQEQLVKLATDNNRVADTTAEFIKQDLRELVREWSNMFDIVVSNPPYFPVSEGKTSKDLERAISRTELRCTMIEVLESVKHYTKPGGIAYILYPTTRSWEFKQHTETLNLSILSEITIKQRQTKTIFKVVKRQ